MLVGLPVFGGLGVGKDDGGVVGGTTGGGGVVPPTLLGEENP